MVPSVDAVGRCFPFLVARELPAATDPVSVTSTGHVWFEAAEELALEALGDAFDLAAFDRSLPPIVAGTAGAPSQTSPPPGPVGQWIDLPTLAALPHVLRNVPPPWHRPALWWTGGGAEFQPALAITAGLIAPRGFTALLERNPMRHGWDAGSGDAGADETDLAWDRDE
jgi:type VI secretion system protein ImpM